MSHFSGTLYLEVGGKFLFDLHGQRVLPGFDPQVKPQIIHDLGFPFEVIFCVNAKDIESNRMLTSKNISFVDETLRILDDLQTKLQAKIFVVLNLVDEITPKLEGFKSTLTYQNINVSMRYVIPGYPDPNSVISDTGYGKDDYVKPDAPLVLVTGPASNSGKMSTCLGQIYHDLKHGKNSGYAKYELFPIYNLPLEHPVNLAYEAATADIGDYNLYDYHHENAYRILDAVNYNRDVEAFPIITALLKKMIPADNHMQSYRSPTDMGMNKAGFAITDSRVCAEAGLAEIQRRKEWYKQQRREGRGQQIWVDRCEKLESRAKTYLQKN
jgi:uncharacterized protein (UPF0371 family)